MLAFKRMGVVLEPRTKQPKTIAKFNAGMVLDGGVVHLLFRYAEWRKEFDPECMSCYAKDEIRYARLTPQGRLLYESPLPLLAPSLPGDTSGCQDPRIVTLDGWYYITYCGWDKDSVPAGQDKATLAFARTRDFKTAEKLGVIRHYTWDKDHFLFPGRVNGKVALVHRIMPNIQIDYFDSVEAMLDQRFWDAYTEQSCERSTVMRALYPWENGRLGGSTPPVKTEAGWLFTYHGVSPEAGHNVYRMGLALLDLENPSKVIARLPYPVLEPVESYERAGDIPTVVFPVGAYIHDGQMVISYGAADRVTALATAPVAEILDALRQHRC